MTAHDEEMNLLDKAYKGIFESKENAKMPLTTLQNTILWNLYQLKLIQDQF